MIEQRISIKTAALACEKGFNINTGANCWLKTLDGEIIHNSEREHKIEHDRCELYLRQPTQSLLQKWVREKHDLHVEVQYINSPVEEKWMYEILRIPKGIAVLWDAKLYYDTFEEALEAGLLNALSLIK